MKTFLTAVVCCLNLQTVPSAQTDSPNVDGIKADNKYAITLEFSRPDYDPFAPSKTTLKCVLANRSNEAITVTEAGKWLRISGGGLDLYERGPRGQVGKKKYRQVTIAPGKSGVVFEQTLVELFRTDQNKNRVWYWDWRKRSMPPPSPIQGRVDKYLPLVGFQARGEVMGEMVESSVAYLRVRTIPKQKTPPIRLECSVDVFDTKKPAGVLKLVVDNNTDRRLDVPANYDAANVTLDAMEGLGRRMKLTLSVPRPKRSIRWIQLDPGKSKVILEVPLADILQPAKDGKWSWQWDANQEPPNSPLKLHGVAPLQQLLLQASLKIDGKRAASEFVSLLIR